MKCATLCIPATDTDILLGNKKLRFGAGKVNAYGGKIRPGETPEAATVRELFEECGLTTTEASLEKCALLVFYFNEEPVFLMHTYFTRQWSGEPRESDEMTEHTWYPRGSVPFDDMWDADRIWMKEVLEGKKVAARIFFKIDGIPGKDKEVFDRIEYDETLWDTFS